MNHVYDFTPPYDDPQTEEEFEACHRAYWNFIADHNLDRKPKIRSSHPIHNNCYGCEFMKSRSKAKPVFVCAGCPLCYCDRLLEAFYYGPTEESRIGTARRIANAWKFTSKR